MCASHGDFSKPQGAMKVKASFGNSPRQDPGAVTSAGRTAGPSDAAGGSPSVCRAEQERTRWYPKDGELCLSRTKSGETLMEVRSDSDVQIDRQT